jgi:hypothetical protein
MTRASLIHKAFELLKLVQDTRAVIGKALGDEAAMRAVALAENIVQVVATFVENPSSFTIEDFRRLQAKIDAANKLVAQALTGQGQQPPLRTLQGEAADDEEAGDDTEIPPDVDQEGDDLDEDDSGARFPSEIQPRPPAGKKPRKPRTRKKDDEGEIERSAIIDARETAELRMAGLLSKDDTIELLLPVRRKIRDSAIFQTPGGE